MRQVLQSVTILLQSATGITKCDDYYKVRQYTPPPSHSDLCVIMKLRQTLSTVTAFFRHMIVLADIIRDK